MAVGEMMRGTNHYTINVFCFLTALFKTFNKLKTVTFISNLSINLNFSQGVNVLLLLLITLMCFLLLNHTHTKIKEIEYNKEYNSQSTRAL